MDVLFVICEVGVYGWVCVGEDYFCFVFRLDYSVWFLGNRVSVGVEVEVGILGGVA